MSEDIEMLSARIPSSLKDLVDADSRNNQEVVEAALWREFGGKRVGDLERRIEEKERRIDIVLDEKEERESEIEELRRELNALEEKYDEKTVEKKAKLEQARESLNNAPLTVDNPAVQNWAEKVDMTPEELIEELGGEDE